MLSRIRRWRHRRRNDADTATVVIRLPRTTAPDPAPTVPVRPAPDEQHARAALLTALGEHPAPAGGDSR